MSETVEKTGTGAILYDPTVLNQLDDSTFEPGNWPRSSAIEGHLRSAGRGTTSIVSDGERRFVIRHYHRGGLAARVTNDAYLWSGERRVRSFAEYRLLAGLFALGLPVPKPVAARYHRRGIVYTADLITEYVPGLRPLSVRIASETTAAFWRRLGAGIHDFHAAGVNHADLNAYNVQVDENDGLFVLDFDRGRLMPAGAWRERNLARLHRSLRKVSRLDGTARFSARDWAAFNEGYFGSGRSA